jgi:hypothetical protein
MWLDRWEEGRSDLDGILEDYESSSLWIGDELDGFVSAPLVRGSNPERWRRFITIWLDSFGKSQRLAELGQALVRSLRVLHLPWISDQAARDWCETWEELADGIDEMALPLKLLRAGVEYRVDRDRRVLLGLAREERGLLEPWLVNLLEEKPTEVDREMEELLQAVEKRLAAEAEAERSRAFWTSPAPALETLDFARLLEDYGDLPAEIPSRLLPGAWQNLDRQEAERLLLHAASHDEAGARAWSRPGLSVLGVDRRPLSFDGWSLYQVHVTEGGDVGAVDLAASEDQALVLDGLNKTFHGLVGRDAIRLEDAESQAEYTRLFSCTVRGEERFRAVDAPEDLRLAEGAELPANVHIQPWESKEQAADDDGPLYTGTVLYCGTLFRVEYRLISPEKGMVEMLEDEPLATDLACGSERFDGPIRFFVPPASPDPGATPPARERQG